MWVPCYFQPNLTLTESIKYGLELRLNRQCVPKRSLISAGIGERTWSFHKMFWNPEMASWPYGCGQACLWKVGCGWNVVLWYGWSGLCQPSFSSHRGTSPGSEPSFDPECGSLHGVCPLSSKLMSWRSLRKYRRIHEVNWLSLLLFLFLMLAWFEIDNSFSLKILFLPLLFPSCFEFFIVKYYKDETRIERSMWISVFLSNLNIMSYVH